MDADYTNGNKNEEDDDYNELFKGIQCELLKVVLVGDAGVGKTHIMNR